MMDRTVAIFVGVVWELVRYLKGLDPDLGGVYIVAEYEMLPLDVILYSV